MSINKKVDLSWVGLVIFSVCCGIVIAVFGDPPNKSPECQITAQQEERYDALYKDCLVLRAEYHPASCKSVAKEMICGD